MTENLIILQKAKKELKRIEKKYINIESDSSRSMEIWEEIAVYINSYEEETMGIYGSEIKTKEFYCLVMYLYKEKCEQIL